MKLDYLKQEALVKKELMDHEFQINMQLNAAQDRTIDRRDSQKEDRKDEREERKQKHQKEIKQGESLKKFESSGNDVVGGGLGLERFNPK